MNNGFILGFFASIIAAAVTYLIITKITGSKHLKGATFDERQLLARGEAYKYGFYTLLFGILAIMIINEFNIAIPVTQGLALFIIALIAIDVYAVYSVLNDAYFGLDTKWRAYLTVIILVILANIIGGAFSLADFMKEGSGVLDLTNGANVCVAAAFIPIMISIAVKKLAERRDDDEES